MLPGFCSHDFWCSPEPCWAIARILSLSRNGTYTPHIHTISRYASVILMNRWQGSPLLGRCQITYHPSYLNTGRPSVLVSRTLHLPPTTSHQCPDYWARSPTQYLLWRTGRAISSSMLPGVITNNNIYSRSISIIQILLKHNIVKIKNILHNRLLLSDMSGKIHLPFAKTGEISIAPETVYKQRLWLYSLLQRPTENSPQEQRFW